MGSTLIRQPNGKLMIWSSIVDEPIYYDITEDEYVKIKADEAREEAKYNLKKKNFIKDPCYINCLISAYGKDTEEINELIALLDLIGYDSKKIRETLNEQLAEQIEDEDNELTETDVQTFTIRIKPNDLDEFIFNGDA